MCARTAAASHLMCTWEATESKTCASPCAGRHQAENACAALGAVLVLRKRGFTVSLSAIRRGMSSVSWPGRLEYFGHVLLDGAHNDPGVRALCAYCDAWLPKEKTVLVSGMMRDKETDKMCQRLAGRVRCAVLTKPDHPRAMDAGELGCVLCGAGAKNIRGREAGSGA